MLRGIPRAGIAYPYEAPVGVTRVERTVASRSAGFPVAATMRTLPLARMAAVPTLPKASCSTRVSPPAIVNSLRAAKEPGEYMKYAAAAMGSVPVFATVMSMRIRSFVWPCGRARDGHGGVGQRADGLHLDADDVAAGAKPDVAALDVDPVGLSDGNLVDENPGIRHVARDPEVGLDELGRLGLERGRGHVEGPRLDRDQTPNRSDVELYGIQRDPQRRGPKGIDDVDGGRRLARRDVHLSLEEVEVRRVADAVIRIQVRGGRVETVHAAGRNLAEPQFPVLVEVDLSRVQPARGDGEERPGRFLVGPGT